jgi:hypothetical protein
MAEKHLQEVRPYQPLLSQLLEVLMQGFQLADVLPSRAGEWGGRR